MGSLTMYVHDDHTPPDHKLCNPPKSHCQDPADCHDAPCAGSRGSSTSADAPWPYGHQQDNPECGGYPIWGGPKEGPNGMGRNSPGNMWVR